jgi:hypothetical protein
MAKAGMEWYFPFRRRLLLTESGHQEKVVVWSSSVLKMLFRRKFVDSTINNFLLAPLQLTPEGFLLPWQSIDGTGEVFYCKRLQFTITILYDLRAACQPFFTPFSMKIASFTK